MNNKLFLLISFGLAAFNASAQDSVVVSLNKAIELGVLNSKTVKIANAQVQQADAHLAQTKFNQYPDISLAGSHLRVNSPTVKNNFGGSDEPGDEEPQGTPQVASLTYGMIDVTQPIFNGLRLHYAVKSADYLKKAAELDAQNQKEDVVLNIISAYFNFYKLTSTKKLISENLNQARERVRLFNNLEENGVITRNDLLKAQLQQSNIELALLDVNNNIAVANYNLDILLGLPDETPVKLDTTMLSDQAGQLENISYYIQAAQNGRSDLKAEYQKQQAAGAAIKIARGSYYPSVALKAGYVDAYIPDLLTVTNAVNVGLGIQYSLSGLFDGHHKVLEAQAKADQVSLMTDLKWDGIKSGIFKDYAEYQKNIQKIKTLEIASQQAVENFRITQNSYDNSVALLTDLLDAQVQKLQAQVNELHARADAKISYYQLAKDAGLLNKEFISENNY